MSGARVSVLIACYQHGHWLGGALESVFSQTFPALEAVVANDGSTDNTEVVAREWTDRRPGRVHYLETRRVGQARARAAALERASGEFYITLDADDLLEPGMVRVCLEALDGDPEAAVAASDVWMTDESGRVALRRLEQGRMPDWPRVLESNPLGGVAGLLVRRDAARRLGGLAIEGLPGVEDWDFAVRLVRSGSRVVRVPGALARYRQSRSSFSRNPVPMLKARLELLERCRSADPRLPSAVQPMLGGAAFHRLANRHVFYILGVAAAGNRDSIGAVLSHLKPVEPECDAWAAAFAAGASHGCLTGGSPRAAAEAVHEPLAEALARAGVRGLSKQLNAALALAAGKASFPGPRYWLRRLDAWRATRRFGRGGAPA